MIVRHKEAIIAVIAILLLVSWLSFKVGITDKFPLDVTTTVTDLLKYDANRSVMSILNSQKVKADNQLLLEVIRKFHLKPPSSLPYSLTHPEIKDPSVGQAAIIDKYLNGKKGGFFIECGAFDGEEYSNSLYFERYRNWTGILIEASPTTYATLQGKHRKVYSINACLSGDSYPKTEIFLVNIKPTRVRRVKNDNKNKQGYIEVQCFPIYSVLLAMNQLHVDYFSLDVEGAERSVLDSLPWDKLTIDTFSIEYPLWEGKPRSQKIDNLIQYMDAKGYRPIGTMSDPTGNDVIFVKK